MKKSLLLSLLALSFAITTNTGCTPGSSGTTPLSLPDLSNFSLQSIGTFVKGASTIITLASSSLGSGTFNVNYSISGANTLVNQVATLIMNGSTGTFSTAILNASGQDVITINSISNASGSTNASGNNTARFYDSTGLMTTNITGAAVGPSAYRATYVTASLTAGTLVINGVMWTQNQASQLNLNIANYVGNTGPIYFNANDATNFNATTSYIVAGSTAGLNDFDQHGVITITGTTPLLTGTFTITNTDSSMMNSGTFSCPAP